jgi:hypothetical protein
MAQDILSVAKPTIKIRNQAGRLTDGRRGA